MPCDRLPTIMKHYSPRGRRNRGRPLKRLLDTWDQNGSTSGLTPWQTYDDDRPAVTTFRNCTFCPKNVFTCFLRFPQQKYDYSSTQSQRIRFYNEEIKSWLHGMNQIFFRLNSVFEGLINATALISTYCHMRQHSVCMIKKKCTHGFKCDETKFQKYTSSFQAK